MGSFPDDWYYETTSYSADSGGGSSGSYDLASVHGSAIRLNGGRGQCLLCGKRFSSYGVATRHVDSVHGGSEGISDCSVCGRQYKNSLSLKEHMRQAHKIYQRDLPKN